MSTNVRKKIDELTSQLKTKQSATYSPPTQESVRKLPEDDSWFFDKAKLKEVVRGTQQYTFEELCEELWPGKGYKCPDGNTHYFTKCADPEDVEILKDIPDKSKFAFVRPNLDVLLTILVSLETKKPLLLFGEAGSGKTLFTEVAASMTNRPYKRITGMSGLEINDVIGGKTVTSENGAMAMLWEDGDIAWAVRHGYLLADDEPFKNDAGVNMPKMSLYETRDPLLKLVGNHGEREIRPHENFRVIMADNVRGTGDGTDVYAATTIQDGAFINRIILKQHVPYLNQNEEVEMIADRFPELNEKAVRKMVQLGNSIREAYKAGTIELVWSTRQLEEWAELSIYFQNPARAFDKIFFSSLNDDEKAVVSRLWQDVGFGGYKL